jgi:hypothetical protein
MVVGALLTSGLLASVLVAVHIVYENLRIAVHLYVRCQDSTTGTITVGLWT